MAKSKFVRLQDLLYKFVVDNMKTDKQTKEDALYISEVSDRFWVWSFDEVYRDFENTEEDPYSKQLSLEDCINEIFDGMFDYYNNRMNHCPGYKVPRFNPYFTYSFAKLKKLYKEVNKIITGKATAPFTRRKYQKPKGITTRRRK